MSSSDQDSLKAILDAIKKSHAMAVLVLLFIGMLTLAFTSCFDFSNNPPFIITISISYIVSSAFGLFSIQYPSPFSILSYKLALGFLIIFNLFLVVFSVAFYFYILMLPYAKANKDSNNIEGAYMFITIIDVLTLIISICMVFMLVKFYRISNEFSEFTNNSSKNNLKYKTR